MQPTDLTLFCVKNYIIKMEEVGLDIDIALRNYTHNRSSYIVLTGECYDCGILDNEQTLDFLEWVDNNYF